MSRRFVLLDRDGTVNEEIGYVLRPDELRLIPGAADGLRELQGLGLGLLILTNQSPIGRGLITRTELDQIHSRLKELLAASGVTLDGIESCPHRPDEGCACRKPGTLMVDRASAAMGFEPGASWMVGDHGSDLRLGRAVGARTILVLTGHGREEHRRGASADADHVVADLREAASVIREDLLAGVEP